MTALLACKAKDSVVIPDDPEEETTTEEVVTTVTPEPPLALRITEIMYHPVLEENYDDRHEFVEIHNPGTAAVSLEGWRLNGTGYDFPAGTQLDAGAFVVIAKDPDALIARYGLDAALVLGPYDGQLDNGGETVSLMDADDAVVDAVEYDDAFPWPIAADALGAGETWLPPSVLPLEGHRYGGTSLERVSLAADGSEPANWVASDIDAMTPGAAFSGLRDEPLPIVEAHEAWAIGEPAIGDNDPAQIDVTFSDFGELADVQIEYFVDDIRSQGEPTLIAMADAGDDADREVSVSLPAQAAHSIIRYRILADRGEGVEVVSPRSTDPFAWHAYFVDPELTGNTRIYQLYLAPNNWTQMWNNLDGGREIGCDANATWNNKVPGVFIFEGKVYDVHVRYQGSRYNRTNGASVGNWPHPGPAEPSPLSGLSYRISFPRYNRFEGRKAFALNKLTQGCPGLTASVGFELFRQAGLPASTTRYAQLHINGGYYRYMMEIERPGEEMMQAWHDDLGDGETYGHLYKSIGLTGDAGPFGWGDARPLFDSCGHTAYDRYTWTYDRKTYTWETHDALIQMIEELDAFRAPNGVVDVPGTRAYLAANFDVERMLDHLALTNWSVPFDDYFQNHFLYQRRGDGLWMLMAWDVDLNWGEWANNSGGGPQASVWGGLNGDLVGGIDANRSGWWNRVKDSFLQAYQAEFLLRLRDHNAGVLHPDNIAMVIADVQSNYDVNEANGAASAPSCDMASEAAAFQTFADGRYDFIHNSTDDDLIHW